MMPAPSVFVQGKDSRKPHAPMVALTAPMQDLCSRSVEWGEEQRARDVTLTVSSVFRCVNVGESSENHLCGDRRPMHLKGKSGASIGPHALPILKAMQLMSAKLSGKEEGGKRWGVLVKLSHKEGAGMRNRLCCTALQSDNLQA